MFGNKKKAPPQNPSQKALDWDEDRVTRARRSALFGWLVAGILAVVCLMMGGALAALAPLKTVEPYVIRVDNTTGVVEVMTALKDAPNTYEEAIDNSFLARYLRARASYSPETLRHDFRVVELMSTPVVASEYGDYMSNANPNSPINVYGRRGEVEVDIQSITEIGTGLSQIRFTKSVKSTQGSTANLSQWIATIAYKYVNAEMSESDRLINPLGFQVTEYRIDPANIGG